MTTNITIGQRFKQLREATELSQSDVANAINKNLRTYQRYERDETIPQVDVAIQLAELYGVSFAYIVGVTDDPDEYSI